MALVATAAICIVGASAVAALVLAAANSPGPPAKAIVEPRPVKAAGPVAKKSGAGTRAKSGAGTRAKSGAGTRATSGCDPEETLNMHNDIRAKHPGRKPLVWDDRIAASAQRKAETCVFEHLGNGLDGKPLGENLAWAKIPSYTCAHAIRGMYATEEKPKGTEALLSGGRGNHAVQILYPTAKKVGCGIADCPQYGRFIACHYDVMQGGTGWDLSKMK